MVSNDVVQILGPEQVSLPREQLTRILGGCRSRRAEPQTDEGELVVRPVAENTQSPRTGH